MKKLFAISLLILLFPGIKTLNAQKNTGGKKACIYALNITFENEFVKSLCG